MMTSPGKSTLEDRLEAELRTGSEPTRRAALDVLASGRVALNRFVPLLEAILDDEDPSRLEHEQNRASALRLLALVGAPLSELSRNATPSERLECLVRTDPAAEVREASLRSFVRLAPHSSAVTLCQDCLSDTAPGVRSLAAAFLSDLLEDAEPAGEFEFEPFD